MPNHPTMCEHEAATALIALAMLLMIRGCLHASADPAAYDRAGAELRPSAAKVAAVLDWLR